MTTTVHEFIKGKLPVITVTKDDSLTTALKRMIEHDFSQLPVINADNIPEGILTSDSILQTLNSFGIVLDKIPLRHAMVKKPHRVNENIDLLDLFDDMGDGYALVTDDSGRLVGIVTSFDTTEYFRQRAQDILFVENIESTLKDFVQLAFYSHVDGEARLETAIESMTNSGADLRKQYEKGVRHYLSKREGAQAPPLDQAVLDETFAQHLDDKRPPTPFDKLTLSNYISLFLHKDRWARFADIFELDKTAVENLLKSVLNTRNDLSHFRDITRDQSAQLRYCYDLLVSHQQAIAAAFAQETSLNGINEPDETAVATDNLLQIIDDEPAPGDSRYAPLAIWLQSQPLDKELVRASFAGIEKIIGGDLPESAYKNRAWWANDTVGHVQSKQWLDVGWRVASVNMTDQAVRFARIKERQKAYIDFYSALINELQQQPGFTDLRNLPDGGNWYATHGVHVRDRAVASFNYSFGRSDVFRVELYIDSGEETINKEIFDALLTQKDEIEGELGGHELLWQRLDNRRASRIARIFKGHITDSEEDLADLRQKVVQAMVNYVKVMRPRVITVSKEIL